MEITEIKSGIEQLGKDWAEFKDYHQRELNEIKKSGVASAETKAALEKIELRLSATELKLSKPPEMSRGTRDEELVSARKSYFRSIAVGKPIGEDVRKALSEAQVKAMTAADDTAGGYGIMPQYETDIVKTLKEFSPVRSVSRVSAIGKDELKVPRRTGSVSVEWTGEIESAAETKQSFGQIRIPVHPITAYVEFSVDNLEDSDFDLEAELTDEFTEQLAVKEGNAMVVGDGVDKARGFLNVAETYKSGTNGNFTADNIIELMVQLKSGYWRNATFMLNKSTVAKIRKFKATGSGDYIWTPFSGPADQFTGGFPGTILGRPYVIAPDMPESGTTGGKPIAVGDFRRAYRVVDRTNPRITRDLLTGARAGLVKITLRRRVGGDCVLPEAIKVLVESV
jgi:HK97 family phage major capsid protein